MVGENTVEISKAQQLLLVMIDFRLNFHQTCYLVIVLCGNYIVRSARYLSPGILTTPHIGASCEYCIT